MSFTRLLDENKVRNILESFKHNKWFSVVDEPDHCEVNDGEITVFKSICDNNGVWITRFIRSKKVQWKEDLI